jgi:hypothetical protein
MLFIVSWTSSPEHRDAVFARFVKTGGTPPAGVKMIGRWHNVGRLAGFAVAEASDPALMQKWALDWSDLMTMDVCPAIVDDQAAPLIAAALGKQ